jgi:putative heme iron utilization protein
MDYMEFISKFKSLLIATSSDNIPHSSYSTFVIHENSFYILISAIAKHSKNLKKNPNASVMFIEDESSSTNIFARTRVSVDTNVEVLEKDSDEYKQILELYTQKFDKEMVNTLISLDFNIYRLKPKKLSSYFGFGEAKETEKINLKEE